MKGKKSYGNFSGKGLCADATDLSELEGQARDVKIGKLAGYLKRDTTFPKTFSSLLAMEGIRVTLEGARKYDLVHVVHSLRDHRVLPLSVLATFLVVKNSVNHCVDYRFSSCVRNALDIFNNPCMAYLLLHSFSSSICTACTAPKHANPGLICCIYMQSLKHLLHP